MVKKATPNLYRVRNAISGLYYGTSGSGFCCSRLHSTIVDETELAILKYCYENVETEPVTVTDQFALDMQKQQFMTINKGTMKILAAKISEQL